MTRVWDVDSWMVFFWDRFSDRHSIGPDAILDTYAPDFDSWIAARNRKELQPFLLGPGGMPDQRINDYFDSPRRRQKSMATNKKAAYAICLWLNFLLLRGVSWDKSNDLDIEAFMAWRRSDPLNPRPVQGNSWQGDLGQLLVFYRWANFMFGIDSPIATSTYVFEGRQLERPDVASKSVRQGDVKWLSPGAYDRWRDVGLLGISEQGVEKSQWRPRCEERDHAYVEGLYRSGLRMQEWASVLVSELPTDGPTRWFFTAKLSDSCAKGKYGHKYWIDRTAMNLVWTYLQHDRGASVRRAQESGAYDNLRGIRTIVQPRHRHKLTLRDASGFLSDVGIDELSPSARLLLFIETESGLEPAMLWLNEDGLPRPKSAWFKTFNGINARLERSGIENSRCTMHMLRHSFALRWYTIGKFIREGRLGHLSEGEARDFREEFGSTWNLVATMLGHRDVKTTKAYYLEPFTSLEVDLLFEYAADDSTVRQFIDAVLRRHPSVISVDGADA